MTHSANEQPENRDNRAGLLLAFLIGIAVAVSVGVALDCLPIGIVIGAGVGLPLGIAFTGQEQQTPRPLTIAGVVLLLAGVIMFAAMMSLVLPRWWCDYPIINLLSGC